MEKLVPLVNEIHDILYQSHLSNKLQLPQIIVLGAQSTGKSSVLEGIIGKEILPRGKGIVTRRPIEIQLQYIDGSEEWVEFLEKKNEKFKDFSQVLKEVENLTDNVCGMGKEISNIPLKIKFFSNKVVDMLLVDLPGLTKNPVGDQPKNIEVLIKDLIYPYIQNPNSIILAVSKGNDDLANSESLKLARKVDPFGERTLGVITQLDVMDQSVDISNDLQNKTYPLKLAYVGVVLRAPKDIEDKKSLQNQIKDEEIFFQNHKFYQKLQDKMGIPYLVKMLNATFVKKIKECIPDIRQNLFEILKQKEHDIRQFGEIFTNSEFKENKGLFLLGLLAKYSNFFSQIINGKYLEISHEELIGGSRINYIFNEIFQKTINGLDPYDIISDEDIRIAIGNSNGLRNSLFLPEMAFENLVKQQIKRLLVPSLDCSHLVYEELRRILYMINIPEIERKNIFSVMEAVLNKCLIPTDDMINKLIEIELGYINTNHPDFIGGTNALISLMQDQNDESHNQDNDILNNDNLLEDVKNYIPKEKSQFIQQKQKVRHVDFYNNQLTNLNQIKDEKKKYYDSSYIGEFSQMVIIIIQSMLSNPPNQIKINNKPSKREIVEVEMIKKLIQSYFNVIKKNINDSVPKTIVTLLINQSKNICERELISNLYKTELFEDLLSEDKYITKMRQELKQQIIQLRNCLAVLNNIDSRF